MHFRELDRGELIAVVGDVLLVVSLFLSWFHLGNVHATLGPCKGPDSGCTGWESLPIVRYLFLAGAIAPLVLAYVVLRGHGLAWPRGEMTAVVGLLMLTGVVFFGPVYRPGNPRSQIGLSYGWWIALAGALMMLLGAVYRTQESTATRKPPGVL